MRWIGCTFVAYLLSLTMKSGIRYGAESLRWGILRALIKERDGYRCRECGRRAEYGVTWVEIHHLRRVVDGGGYAPWNLTTLCVDCHRTK